MQAQEFVQYKWENENIKAEGNLVSGMEDGLWKYYDESGKISQEVTYKFGEINGPFKHYYPNGNLSEEGFFFEHRTTAVDLVLLLM